MAFPGRFIARWRLRPACRKPHHLPNGQPVRHGLPNGRPVCWNPVRDRKSDNIGLLSIPDVCANNPWGAVPNPKRHFIGDLESSRIPSVDYWTRQSADSL